MSDKTEKRLITILPSILSVILGLFIGWLLLLIPNPQDSLSGLGLILSGGFKRGASNIGNIMHIATPIILTGLSVSFASKSGLFNIGASGQFTAGAFCAIAVGIAFPELPAFIHIPLAVLAGCAAGALCGAIVGALKTYFNVSEVISGIMLNYVVMLAVNMLIKMFIYDSEQNRSLKVASTAIIGRGLKIDPGFFVAIICIIAIKIILDKTTFGYELITTGKNKNAAQYAGMNSNKCALLSMVIAGVLAGLGGVLMYLSDYGEYLYVVEKISQEGFMGISVSLLGLSSPVGTFIAGIFIALLTSGGNMLQLYGYTPDIINMIVAVMVYCGALTIPARKVIEKLIDKYKTKGSPVSGEEVTS